jgi:hypothetical protein
MAGIGECDWDTNPEVIELYCFTCEESLCCCEEHEEEFAGSCPRCGMPLEQV